ncbi:MAG: hypothetical protein Rubg2KO_28840 [Rubricoccaceae bacterium]
MGLVLASAPVQAQTLGKISGRVTDTNGEPLPGATVVIDGTTQGASADLDGYYFILQVRPGTYTLRVSYIGYTSTIIENVEVEVDRTTTIDASLGEEVVGGEEVVVRAERPLVEPARTTTTAVLGSKELSVLPVINIQDAINLQAGVSDGHFRGGRTGEVAYLVNGVPINNSFNGQQAFEVEQNMVESLEVISGVFNAEYGQALSGVVNITTKGVPSDWNANALAYIGSLASTRELEFVSRTAGPGGELSLGDFQSERVSYLDAAAFPNLQDYQLSIGGPIIADRVGFQLSTRYLNDNSYFIGRDLFSPSDSSTGLNSGQDPSSWSVVSSGDGDFVPMNTTERLSVNGNVSFELARNLRLSYDGFYQGGTYTPFSQFRKYNPRGVNHTDFVNHTHIVGVRYTLGQSAFANLSYSFLYDDTDVELYDDPTDPRYVAEEQNSLQGTNAFSVAGNDLFTSWQRTETHTIVGNYTHQLNRVHLFKTGFQIRQHGIDNRDFGIERSFRTGNVPQVSPDRFADNTLRTNPRELAVYVQDKMELDRMIINAGLRFDYFDPDYEIPVDWTQAGLLRIPNPESPADSISNRTTPDVSYQVSPRFGIAFPISATGVMRFSAGLFFQVPNFGLLYTNPEYEVNPLASSSQFGNPGLKPERTLSFELGLQQGFTDDIGVDVTIFAKDIRNLVGQEIVRDPRGDFAIRWINTDYGNVRGITFSLFKRGRSPLSASVDYTLQFAQGTASSPGEAFGREQSGLAPTLSLIRLNWDRRHILNTTISYAPSATTSLTAVGRLQSGTPYTTVRNFVRSPVDNNADRPLTFVTDLRAYYKPPFLPVDASLFLQVENLLDSKIVNGVYADSGRPDETIQLAQFERQGVQVGGVNSLQEFFYNQGFYGAPRRVSFGLSLDL